MDIISYKQTFESEIINLWNRNLTADTVSVDRFRSKVIFDDNFNEDLALVAIENEEIVGFCLGNKRKYPYLDRGLEPEKAWISILFVDKKYCRKGIGSKLVNEVERRLATLGAKMVTLGSYSPSYFFPGIDEIEYKDAIPFFEKLAYLDNGEAVSMSRSLWDYRMHENTREHEKKLLIENNICFQKFDYKYSIDLLSFAGKHFGGGWKRDLLLLMQSATAADKIWICLRNEEVIGFCMREMDGTSERFGPFGIREDLRSKGLGGVLFEHMLEDMKSRMINQIYFLWTDGAAIKFYEKHGLKIVRKYKMMRKEL